MIQSEVIQHNGSPAILVLTLDKPKGNILDTALIEALLGALADVPPSLRAIVFDGAGGSFSFGASVEEHQSHLAADMLACFHGLFRRLAELCIPTCALVRGMCLGGGMELASWCTWIVAAEDAKFGQPEIKLAVFPPIASLLLPWRIGAGPALDICVSGRNLRAEEAYRLGLVTVVTDEPRTWWDAFAERNILPKSAVALRMAERALRMPLLDALETQLPRLERLYLDELMATHDANEGIGSFLERRQPVFEHR